MRSGQRVGPRRPIRSALVSVGALTGDARRDGTWAALRDRVLRDPAITTVAALTVLAAVLRFTRIGHQGFWFDEANTAQLVHFSPGEMIGRIPKTESTPPLYYCLAWVWARVFGYGETGLRSLSAAAGMLIVPVAYAAGAKLISRRAGVIAAALTACNPMLIWYSQEARSYSLLALLSACTLLTFVYAREHPTPRALAWWVITVVLALATHYYALLVIAPEAIWLLALYHRRRPVQLAMALTAVCGLGLMALAISQNSTGHASWIRSAPLGRRLAEVVPQFLVGFGSVAYNELVWAAIGLCLAALALLATFGSPAERRRTLVVGAIAIAGLVLNLALVAAGIDDLLTRNMIALWMPAALVIAGSLAIARARWAGVALTVGLCAIGIAAAVSVAANRTLQRPDWRGVARVVGSQPTLGSGGRAILIQHYKDLLPLSLYLSKLNALPPHAGVRVRELDVISFTDPRTGGFCWWGSACNLWPSRIQATYAIPGFREAWRRQIYQFTILRLVADRPRRLTPAIVSRALTATMLQSDGLLYQR
jgi:mannosyltransferase